ncbi:GNAT family N-acetyltransferase [Actinoplanes sp. NPDC023936]|uniref:GNAT family N-acetyltransferase n=1 Tax=Actinoplanes sp. NPDC023936 TaxID=3154910 RepID=UPI0033C39690
MTFTIASWPGFEVISRLDELAEIYAEIYSEPPYNSGTPSSVAGFIDRTTRQAAREGFRFLAAIADQQIAGFSFGVPIAEGAWWASDEFTEPPADLRAAPKFAVIELVVRKRWRFQGIGHRLLRQLLDGRPERYAILTARTDAPARQMYERWGWIKTGTARHSAEFPTMDALALPLPASSTTTRLHK